MKKTALVLFAAIYAALLVLACGGDRAAPVDAGAFGATVDASIELAIAQPAHPPPPSPHREKAAPYPFPPPGDAGTVLTSQGTTSMPAWVVPTGAAATLPDGGAGAIWYENGSYVVTALPACSSGQLIDWTGSPPLPACVTVAGDVTGAPGSTTVGKIQGNTVTSGALTKGQFLVASSTSNWAATTLSGDVVESAVTPGSLEVTQLLSNALPSLASGCLEWTGTAWAFTACSGGSSVTWANDLSGSSNTHQYVASISGSAGGGGTVTVTATPLDFSQASTIQTTSGALTVDSAAALDLGTTNATSVTIGNTTNATGVSVDVHSGDPFDVQVGAAVVEQLAGLSTDQISLGATPATSGLIRVPSGALTIIGTHAGSTIGSDSSNDLLIQPSTGTVLIGIGSGATTLDAENGTTGLSIGISGTASAGGAGVSITAQTAGGSANVGGGLTFSSAAGTTTGASGNINLNVAAPAGTVHGATVLQEGAVGYASLAPVYAASLAPAPAATVNPSNAILYGTSPNGSCGSSATCTPGLVLVNVAAIGGTGSPTEAYFGVEHAGSLQFAAGALPGNVGTYAGFWLGPGIAPSVTNFVFAASSTADYINAPSGGSINGQIAGVTYLELQSTGFGLYGSASTPNAYTWLPISGSNTTQTNTTTRQMYNAQPATSTTATLATVAIPASHAVTIIEQAQTRNHTGSSTTGLGGCGVANTFYNNAGTVTSAGTIATIYAQGLGGCLYTISGTNVLVQLNNTSLATVDVQAVVDITTD